LPRSTGFPRVGDRGARAGTDRSGARQLAALHRGHRDRAVRVRAALARLGGSTIGPHEFLHEVSMLIQQVVPNLTPSWATLDPDTMLPSGALETDLSPDLVRALSRNAILDDDVNGVAAIARRRIPIGTLSELPPAILADSPRVQLIHGPAGIG